MQFKIVKIIAFFLYPFLWPFDPGRKKLKLPKFFTPIREQYEVLAFTKVGDYTDDCHITLENKLTKECKQYSFKSFKWIDRQESKIIPRSSNLWNYLEEMASIGRNDGFKILVSREDRLLVEIYKFFDVENEGVDALTYEYCQKIREVLGETKLNAILNSREA